MANNTGIGRERGRLLTEVKRLPPGPLALKKLAFVRKEYDWAIEDYRNTLNILSDTTYQDRKHFLLELIQNADDAQFIDGEAQLVFIIGEDSLELSYNEKGFTVEDVIAITGAGVSTKTAKKRLAHSFIGEKGIGFKSVFALASHVEIESPPWHFILKKEKCIVPEVLNSTNSEKDEGTRLKVTFSDSAVIDAISSELLRYVCGQVESFLFLQRLSSFKVVDNRKFPPDERSLTLHPSNRSENKLLLTAFPGGISREYVLYKEDEEFSAELVIGRWERLGQEIGPLKRQMIVAALIDSTGDQLPEGRLFCFLPTTVSLPLPVFLQIDGHTKADRERLHDPQYNRWNSYLLKLLPGFLLRAILTWRKQPILAEKLINYVPENQGSDQLAPVFGELISLLKTAPWVRTFDRNNEAWTSPENSIIATPFWTKWARDYPRFRKQAEQLLGKKFVHPDWAANQSWVIKLKCYGVQEIGEVEIASMLELAKLPNEMLEKDENLIGLYKQILALPTLKEKEAKQHNRWRFINNEVDANFTKLKNSLIRASIYPFKGGKFGPLEVNGVAVKVFWLSGRSRRHTGLEGTIDFRIIDVKYTYEPKLDAESSPEKKSEVEKIKMRNEVVRKILTQLEVKELSDENILSELQLPWLLRSHSKIDLNDQKFTVLESIFDAYRAKRIKDEDYVKYLTKLSEVYLPSVRGGQYRLKEMILPEILRLYPIDHLYGKSGQEVFRLPDEILEQVSTKATLVKSHEGKVKKLKEEWRQFLIQCGIRNGPEFSLQQKEYTNPWYFEEKNEYFYNLWQKETNVDFTKTKPVGLITVELDNGTKNLLEDTQTDRGLLLEALYKEWIRKFYKKSQYVKSINSWHEPTDPLAGYFSVRYVHKRRLFSLVKDPYWGGIEKSLIPIKTTKGAIVDSSIALRAPLSKQTRLKMATKYLPLVLEDEKNEAGYNTTFLDSLDIRRPKIHDVNLLWAEVEENYFSDVITVAIELLEIGISGLGLEIYDKDSGSLRPATDFRLGRKGAGVPLIERQYGKLGRTLGELLGLPEENEVNTFIGLFKNVMSVESSKQNDLSGELHRLLKYWQDWDARSRGVIASDFQVTLDRLNITSPPVAVFNDKEKLHSLKKAGILALGLRIENSERCAMERSAKELGLLLPEDVGDLGVIDEKPLDKQDLMRLDRLLHEYVDSLEEHEKSRLVAQAAGWGLGNYEIWGKRVFKASSLERVAGPTGEFRLPLSLPHLDSNRRLFFVEMADTPELILARLLSMCGFTRFKHAYSDIKEITRRIREAAPLREKSGLVIPRNGQPDLPSGNEVTNAGKITKAIISETDKEMAGCENITMIIGSDVAKVADSFVRNKRDVANIGSSGGVISEVDRGISGVNRRTIDINGSTGVADLIPVVGADGNIEPHIADGSTNSIKEEDNLSEPGEINIYDVARAVKEGLLDNRTETAAVNGDTGWNIGLNPEEEEALRENIGSRLIESFRAGPKFFKGKLRERNDKSTKSGTGENLKMVDPYNADPKAFLLAEYGGKCQICATELTLCSGRKWFEIFHICQPRGTAWWADRPFNILSLCPNCHAISKHGGRDMLNIYATAIEVLQGNIFPMEVTQYNGDFYAVQVYINGENKALVISKQHMSYFAGLFKAGEEMTIYGDGLKYS